MYETRSFEIKLKLIDFKLKFNCKAMFIGKFLIEDFKFILKFQAFHSILR